MKCILLILFKHLFPYQIYGLLIQWVDLVIVVIIHAYYRHINMKKGRHIIFISKTQNVPYIK